VAFRLAINGYGRIGRCVLRALYEACLQSPGRYPLEIVAINEPADIATISYLTRYDSTHGRFAGKVSHNANILQINEDVIRVSHEETINDLPWGELGIDAVLECSGVMSSRAQAEQHLQAGAGKVIFSQPADQDVDATIVYGVNHRELTGAEKVISNASCTTNCIVPVIQVLNRALGIEHGVITTIHSAMNDQPVIDAYHHTDLRKTRSATRSIIPVDTALAAGIDRVLPELAGRFEAQAMRVPTLNVSAMDLSLQLAADTDPEQVNAVLEQASRGDLAGILGYTEEPLASCDFNHDPHSCIVDASQTRIAGKRLAKVLTWFDNEWGYANRMLDVTTALLSGNN
jgi:erythrose-4-phosphate dehydrogenase